MCSRCMYSLNDKFLYDFKFFNFPNFRFNIYRKCGHHKHWRRWFYEISFPRIYCANSIGTADLIWKVYANIKFFVKFCSVCVVKCYADKIDFNRFSFSALSDLSYDVFVNRMRYLMLAIQRREQKKGVQKVANNIDDEKRIFPIMSVKEMDFLDSRLSNKDYYDKVVR